MEVVLFAIIAFSLGTVGLIAWSSAGAGDYLPSEDHLRFTTVVFASWLIASVFFGPYFFAIRPPGFFDITIERFLFFLVLMAIIVGLFTGEVRFGDNFTIEMYMFIFTLICIASMLRHGFLSPLPERYASPWFVFISGYFFPFLVFVFAKHYLTSEKAQSVVFHALFFLSAYIVIIAFLEFFGLRKYVLPHYIGDPKILWLHLDRARGPFLNAAINGVAILFGFTCGVHLMTQKIHFSKIFFAGLLLLFFPAVFFTQTRSVYLGFLITLVMLLLFYKTDFPKWKGFALPVALVVVLLFTQGPRLLSSERRTGGVLELQEVFIRFALIQRSAEIFIDNPVTGIGLAQFLPFSFTEQRGRLPIPASAEETTQHNHLLGMLVEIGIIGLLAYLAIYVVIFRRFVQVSRWIPETGFLGSNFLLVGIIVWVVYLNNNMFIEPGYNIFLNSVPFMFGGMVDGLYNKYVPA